MMHSILFIGHGRLIARPEEEVRNLLTVKCNAGKKISKKLYKNYL